MARLTLAFSPCPNDTFIFDALVNRRIQHRFELDVYLHDVEELNQLAGAGGADVIKISVARIPAISAQYQVLASGSALGFGCGPLLVTAAQSASEFHHAETPVFIPGFHTTANLLLSTFYPQLTRKEACVFSEIGAKVLNHPGSVGLLIHENRFTYAQQGLHKLADLGSLWEAKFGMPVPLGCIAIRRDLDESIKQEFQLLLRQSVESALADPGLSAGYVSMHASEMDPVVQQQHIDLYVNRYSVDLGDDGKMAIRKLLQVGLESGVMAPAVEPLFV